MVEIVEKKSKDIVTEVKELAKTDKVVVGAERTIKNLKVGKIEKIFLASNCKSEIREDIEHSAKISDVEIITLAQPNDEFGIMCQKPFPVSVLGVLKE